MASTESANPGSPANSGSTSTSTVTAAANAGSAARGRPAASAASPIAPIVAARTTLGDGRTRMTNPTSATPQSAAASHGPARAHRASSNTAPTHDRHVGAGDRVEVGHPGGPEVLLDGGWQSAGVAHHQTRQQPTRIVGQRRAGSLQAGAQRPGGALRPGRRAVPLRRAVGAEHRRGEVATARNAEPAVGGEALPGQQAPPRRVGRQHEQPHRRVDPSTIRAGEPDQLGRHQQHAGPPGAPDRARILPDDQVGGDRSALLGQGADRGRVADGEPSAGGRTAADHTEADSHGDPPVAPHHGSQTAEAAEQVQCTNCRQAGCRAGHQQHGAAAEVQAGERGEPGRHGEPGQSQIRRLGPGLTSQRHRPLRPRRGPGLGHAERRWTNRGPAHTVTRSLSCS